MREYFTANFQRYRGERLLAPQPYGFLEPIGVGLVPKGDSISFCGINGSVSSRSCE